MMYPLFIGIEALDEISKALDFYEEKRTGLGDDFVVELESLFDKIASEPLVFQVVYGQKRRAVLHRFLFNIIFTFNGSEVDVLAVIHGVRNPSRWQKR